jgi:hypothetical protein
MRHDPGRDAAGEALAQERPQRLVFPGLDVARRPVVEQHQTEELRPRPGPWAPARPERIAGRRRHPLPVRSPAAGRGRTPALLAPAAGAVCPRGRRMSPPWLMLTTRGRGSRSAPTCSWAAAGCRAGTACPPWWRGGCRCRNRCSRRCGRARPVSAWSCGSRHAASTAWCCACRQASAADSAGAACQAPRPQRHEGIQVAARQRCQQRRHVVGPARLGAAALQVQHLVADGHAHAPGLVGCRLRRKRPKGRFWIGKSVSASLARGHPAAQRRVVGGIGQWFIGSKVDPASLAQQAG